MPFDDEAIVLRTVGGKSHIEIQAEVCEECEERIRYFNDSGLASGGGNASCACCVEGAEACDPVMMFPAVERRLEEALAALRADRKRNL